MGEFGKTVKPFNPEVQKKCIGDAEPITCRPADLIKPQLADIEKEMAQYKQQDEDVLSYALFPQVATEFFKYREAQQTESRCFRSRYRKQSISCIKKQDNS